MGSALPEYVQVCPLCNGTGMTEQTYTAGCGGGYFYADGPCEICGVGQPDAGPGYVYKETFAPVGASVLAQIATFGKQDNGTPDNET